MRRFIKVATLATGAALVVGSMAGCGRPDTSGAPAASASAVATDKVTGNLTVWAMGTEGEKLPDLIKKFESENPGVSVKVTAVPWDSAHDKFTSSIAAGTTPDVAMVGTTWMGEFVGLGALDPTPPDLIDKASFFSGAQATTEVGGTSYAVPWYVETRVVYYRTDIAKKAGITAVPTDWDGLKAMAKAMKDKGGAKYGINLQPGGTGSWQTVLPFAWSAGAKIMADDKTFAFDSPEMVEGVKYYQSFFTEGLANKSSTGSPTEVAFTKGETPMFISGPWMRGVVESAGTKPGSYGVFVMPKNKESSSFIGGANLAVFKSTKNRNAAWKLVQFLSKPETQLEWYKMSTDLPSVQAAWSDSSLSGDEMLKVFGEQLKTAQAPPPITTWEQIAGKFDAQIEKVTKTGLEPAQAMKTVQSEAMSIGVG